MKFRRGQVPYCYFLSISFRDLQMVMDLKDVDLFNSCERIDNKELEDFKNKYLSLNPGELFEAFRVDVKDVLNIVSESIPCVGCRRR